MMPYRIGGGLLSTIGAGYQGYQRRKDIEASNALKERRHKEILAAMKGQRGSLSNLPGHGTGIYGFKLTEEEQ